MCGISGFLQRSPGQAAEVIAAQLGTLRHRGPDAEGSFAVGCGAVAQNRLAIIDLADGDPPLLNEDGSVGVAFNGEIYNFRELQSRLRSTGHALRSRCDTEVVVHLAEDLEPVELARCLDGMFAFAVWDSGRERLVLGRDRLGKKPLYYWWNGSTLVFGSEIKAVLAHPAVPSRLNERAIPGYLQFGYVPTPDTFYEGIVSLPPGCVLTAEPGIEPRIRHYWEPPRDGSENGHRPGLRRAADLVRRELGEAVGRRLISDAPLGAFLSGGIDSSAVVALMSQMSDRVTTFTIGFDDADGYDERPYARLVASRYRTDHHEFVVRPDAVELIERLVWHHDQPFGDSSAIPTFLLSELTGRHVKVALSGDGGDELFGGYERFAAALAVDAYLRVPSALRRAARRSVAILPARAWSGRVGSIERFAAQAEQGLPEAYLAWVSFTSPADRARLLTEADTEPAEAYRRAWEATTGRPLLDRLLHINLQTYLLDDLLVKADRMSMAHGLEVRSPFLDQHLLQIARRLPPELKVRGMSLKRVLRVAMRNDLPREILARRKRGFGVPLDRWFRCDLQEFVQSSLLAPDASVRRYLVPDAVQAIVSEHVTGDRSHGHALWCLLTLELFLRRHGW